MAQKATTQTCVLALAATALEAALLSATDMDRIAVIPCLICGHGVSDDFQVFQECEDCGYEARRPLPSQEAIVVTRSVPAPWGPFDCKHYVLGSKKYPTLFQTGSTTATVHERICEIMSEESADLGLYVLATHHYEGYLQERVSAELDNSAAYQKPPVEWGIKGTDYRVGGFDGIIQAIEAVRHQILKERRKQSLVSEAYSRAQVKQTASSASSASSASPDLWQFELEKEERRLKHRRIDLQLSREEFKLEKAKVDYATRAATAQLAVEKERFELEQERRVLFDPESAKR